MGGDGEVEGREERQEMKKRDAVKQTRIHCCFRLYSDYILQIIYTQIIYFRLYSDDYSDYNHPP